MKLSQIPIGNFKLHKVLEKMRIHPIANNGKGKYFECESGDKLYYRIWQADNQKKLRFLFRAVEEYIKD